MAPDGEALLRPVALTGFMGAGKSTVAVLLGDRFQVPVHDLDRLVEEAAGLSIPELFRTEGEAAFRRREARVLAAAMGPEPAVWALGGGTVTVADAVRHLVRVGTRIVWLDVAWDTVAGRVAGGDRPLLAAGPEAGRRLLEARRAVYGRVAAFAVDAGRPPSLVANDIADRLRELHDVA
jgi:shikimate kinase